MPKHKKRHHSSGHMAANGHGMIKENMSAQSTLPQEVQIKSWPAQPYEMDHHLPGPFDGVQMQMHETKKEFMKVYKPYK